MLAPVVLLVDDEPMIRGLIARRLTKDGFRVMEAGDGLEALELLQQSGATIRLMITDIQMPGLKGDELADRMESLPIHPPVLFMSGYLHPGTPLPGPLMQKPFRLDDLSAEVHRLVGEPVRPPASRSDSSLV